LSIEQGSLLDCLYDHGMTLGLAGKNHAFQDGYRQARFTYWEEYDHWKKCAGRDLDAFAENRKYRLNETRFPQLDSDMGLMEGLIDGPEPFDQRQCLSWRIGEDAIQFLDQHGNDPFFLHFSFPDPHWPSIVCDPYYSMYDPDQLPPLDAWDMDWSGHPFAQYVQSRAYGFDQYSEKDIKRIVATYYGQITFIDTVIGRFLNALKEKGLYENSLIVFVSDHGDFAGNYRLVAKTKGFYESLIRIPLLIKFPGGSYSGRNDALISNIDIMPTLLAYCDIEHPKVQGESFLDVLTGKTPQHRQEVFAELGTPELPPSPMSPEDFPAYQKMREERDGIFWFIEYTVRGRAAMVRKDGWKYCYYTGDCEELYNLEIDPLERHNLATDQKYSAMLKQLKNRLMEWLLVSPVS
jgi:arylsulfatase A-like enzyme